jgi:hypothetical protein
MTTFDILNRWLTIPRENEHLEFKEAKLQYDRIKLLEYCVGITNEGASKEAGLIKADNTETGSTRYARYLPFWA